MTTVTIHEAKTHLSALLHDVERLGEPIIICRHKQAVAELVPLPRGKRTVTSARLKPVIRYNPTESTEEEWDDA